MAQPSEMGWSTYQGYEGVFFRGTVPMPQVRPSDSAQTKWLAVVTATEGGRADAFNGYDQCGVSTGFAQLCEFGLFLTSALLGDIRMGAPAAMAPLEAHMQRVGSTFKVGRTGRWRFFSGGTEVETREGQQALFLGCDGKVGSWTDEAKAGAKAWASAITQTLSHPEAVDVQIRHVSARLSSFIMPEAARALDFARPDRGTRLNHAARALYMSYSANLPALAWKQLKLHLEATGGVPDPMTSDWLNGLALILAYGTTVGIWPERYEKIRPTIERLYSVDLIDLREEMDKFRSACSDDCPASPHDLSTVQGIQQALIDLGYDLGPAGADGFWGKKSMAATARFQADHDLAIDGVVGPKTRAAIGAALAALPTTIRQHRSRQQLRRRLAENVYGRLIRSVHLRVKILLGVRFLRSNPCVNGIYHRPHRNLSSRLGAELPTTHITHASMILVHHLPDWPHAHFPCRRLHKSLPVRLAKRLQISFHG